MYNYYSVHAFRIALYGFQLFSFESYDNDSLSLSRKKMFFHRIVSYQWYRVGLSVSWCEQMNIVCIYHNDIVVNDIVLI